MQRCEGKNRAVFIDRDGTINVNVGYIDNPEEFKIYPGVIEGIKLLEKKGFKIIIVTNQSGIGRGYFSKKTLEKINQKMKDELSTNGANIDAIYYCPHHPDENCDCRKPKTGMLETAITDFNINAEKSYFIGDRILDMEAGRRIGCKTVLVPEDKEKIDKEMKESDIIPDKVCDDFYSGILYILNENQNNEN